MHAVTREEYRGADCPDQQLHAVGRSEHKRARSPALAPHHHAGWELCVIASGQVEWWVEQERWSLPASSIYLTAPGELHGAVDQVMQPCRLLWCQVADERCGASWRGLPTRSWRDRGTIAAIIEQLLEECRRPDRHSQTLGTALLDQLVAAVARSAETAGGEAAEPAALRRIRERIERDPAWWPDIEELAAGAGTGRNQLFQLAKQHWHEAPLGWLGRMRIRAARHRLLADDAPITVIAYELGYASSQHFATAFRRSSGLSPSAYRRQHIDA